MTGENWTKEFYGEKILFYPTNLYHYQLPSSNVEYVYKKAKQEMRQGYPLPHIVDIYAVKYLEDSILERGLLKSKPITLELSSIYHCNFHVNGGHHRLQAFYNLIDQGKIPRRTKMPCLAFVEVFKFDSYDMHTWETVSKSLHKRR
jgi:hypothetical protein